MFAGKMKALTFSYDDGVTQDQRLISLFNKYGLKATFNLNSELLGKPGSLLREDVTVAHVKPRPVEVRAIYAGHEVAAHTLTHPMLTEQTDDEIVRQVEQDRLNLIRSMTQLLLPKSLLSADWTALIRFFGVQSVLSPIYF